MASTREVLAVLAIALLLASVVADRYDEEIVRAWLAAAALGLVTLWAVLSYYYARANPSLVSPLSYAALALLAFLRAVYHGYGAIERQRDRVRR